MTDINEDEGEYLALIKRVLNDGETCYTDRTGVGTKFLLGEHLKYDLSNNTLPLLTCRKVSWRNVIYELLWMLRGNTNSILLEKEGVNIWKTHSSREYLDRRHLYDNKVGDIGPSYGFQWRNWGGNYEEFLMNGKTPAVGGVDQIANLVDSLRENPTSRRHILSSWNVESIDDMALPPCHPFVQWHRHGINYRNLSCTLYQRSGDLALGIPQNIAFYAAFTHILAKALDLEAKKLTITIGNAHVYLNHMEAMRTISTREPYASPRLHVDTEDTLDRSDPLEFIESLDEKKHFHLSSYHHHPALARSMLPVAE